MGTEAPAVTVVIPAYNLERYIEDAVNSVLRQTFSGPVSIIVLDDGSSDRTLWLAQKIAERVSTVTVHTQPNQGRVATRNRLLELARTELVAWIDADDIAAPTWLADQVELLLSDAKNVAVSGQGYAMTPDALPIGPIIHPLTSQEIERRHLDAQANAFFQSCVLTKKSGILQAGGYRPKYPAGEDFDLWLRVSEIGRLRNLDECHLYYRVHSTSANATQSVEQRRQGLAAANEARHKRGLPLLHAELATIPPPKKDDWNRRVYWINIAMKSGNPWTAVRMIGPALRAHRGSVLLWILLLVAACDTLLCWGNRTKRFAPGKAALIGKLPWFSAYRFGRWLNRHRRRLRPAADSAVGKVSQGVQRQSNARSS